MRALRLFSMGFRLSLMTAALYRVNLALMLVQSLLNSLMSVLSVRFIYESVDDIAGWSRDEMVVLVCTALAVNQLYRGLIRPNQNRFIAGVADGQFDKMMMRPMSLIFQCSFGQVDLSSLLSAAAPLAVVAAGLGGSVHPARIALYLTLVLSAVAALSAFTLLLYTAAFRFIRVDGLDSLYYFLMDIAGKPREMFSSRAALIGFTLFLPALPLANAPAAALLSRAAHGQLTAALAASALLCAGAALSFRRGLRRYSSASS